MEKQLNRAEVLGLTIAQQRVDDALARLQAWGERCAKAVEANDDDALLAIGDDQVDLRLLAAHQLADHFIHQAILHQWFNSFRGFHQCRFRPVEYAARIGIKM